MQSLRSWGFVGESGGGKERGAQLALDSIPDLHFAAVGTHREVGAALAPRDAADGVLGLSAEFAQLGDLGVAG